MILLIPYSIGAKDNIKANEEKFKVSLEKRIPSDSSTGSCTIVNEIQEWNPKETAIIICDMWNEHWCKGATDRVTEMAPFMNKVVSLAREKGILIVHAPSSCVDYYKNHPARKLGQKYKNREAKDLISNDLLDSETGAIWPIDQKDGGCDCEPHCKQGNPWTKQIDLIEISNQDAISDSGVEIAGLFKVKDSKNVILMGVHENMCVIGRSFGLRNMVRLGKNVVVMRDLTDTMYNSKQWPVVSHFTGTSLMTEYIETYVCSSIVSCDFTGQKQFRFKNDNRQIIAFIIAENEYQANQTLPEFDQDVLGGNYQGHYGSLKVGIEYSVVPGMENHPLFTGVSTDDFIGPVARLYSLYKNRPLRSPDIQVLLLGTIPDRPSEPVLWINTRGKGKVIYTSLGHWEDWKNENSGG